MKTKKELYIDCSECDENLHCGLGRKEALKEVEELIDNLYKSLEQVDNEIVFLINKIKEMMEK